MGGYLQALVLKGFKGNVFFTCPPKGYFPCHLCQLRRRCGFFTKSSIKMVALAASSHPRWAHHYGSFFWGGHWDDLALEEWGHPGFRGRNQGLLVHNEQSQAFVFSITPTEEQGDTNYAVITRIHGQRGELLCKDAAVFHLPLPWMIFSLFLHRMLFLYEYLRNANRNPYAITQRPSRCTGWMVYWLLEKDSDGSARLHSFDMLQVLGPRSAGAGWVRFHEHNWLNPARQPPARILQEDAPCANFPAWKQIAKHKSEPTALW